MLKILFLTLHRKNRSPGQRYRHEQYIGYLESHGIYSDFSPLLDANSDRIFYSQGRYFRKILVGLSAIIRRLKDVFRANDYDYIFIYRDAFFFGTFFEKALKRTKAELVFDFDDAIWLMDKNSSQGLFNLLKNPSKTSKIISMCDTIIAGNKYLSDYASKYASDVRIIPSTIDMMQYHVHPSKNERICIGWTGSFSTIKHFMSVKFALLSIKSIFGSKVYFKLIGDPGFIDPDLELSGISWNSETEAQDLSELDIGIMPLPNDQWSQGKCGMKGLQYMALEIPTIMSPVGVNKEIIKQGENGFLADTHEEWVEKLSLLIEDGELRKRIGKAGRKTVVEHYSVEANKEKWLKVFKD